MRVQGRPKMTMCVVHDHVMVKKDNPKSLIGARESTPSCTHMYTPVDVEMQAPAIADVTKVTSKHPE